LDAIKGIEPDSRESAYVQEMTDVLEGLRYLWDEALFDAMESYQWVGERVNQNEIAGIDYDALETAKNEIEEKYNQVNAEFEEMKPKYEDYVQAEQARIDAELDAQKDAEFAKYESVLTDNVEFEALKEKKADMTVKEIESECAILYARKNLAQANFSKADNGNMTAGLVDNNEKDGFVSTTRYGYIPVSK
jgi:hypothetical protein